MTFGEREYEGISTVNFKGSHWYNCKRKPATESGDPYRFKHSDDNQPILMTDAEYELELSTSSLILYRQYPDKHVDYGQIQTEGLTVKERGRQSK